MATFSANGLDSGSVKEMLSELKKYRTQTKRSVKKIAERLATMGAVRASLEFARAPYNGTNDVSISVRSVKDGWLLRASGQSVLFIEYGSGVTYGYGHPEPMGYGPGTYNPSSPKWNDPNGWWYAHGKHTYGNPPAAAMYHAEQDIRREMQTAANEVLDK